MGKYITKAKKNAVLLLFLLPAVIPLIIFWVYPIFRSVSISFTDWDYMTPEYNVVGLDNYINLLADSGFQDALMNTLVFSVGTIVPTIVGGLALAMLLKRKCKGNSFYKMVLFSPWITPTVAISIVWTWIYEPEAGVANMVLKAVGLNASTWINSSDTAMLSVIIVTVWKSMGYAMIFYLSALERVPSEMYEAAGVDGAGHWQQFIKMTIPLISPTTFFLTVMTSINALQAYDQIQILTQGGPSGSTRTLLYLYYQLGFEQFNMGQGTATAVLLILITIILSMIQFIASKKLVHY